MKKHQYKTIFFALLLAMTTSCKKDFLNIVPKGKQVAITTDDYSLIMNDPAFYANNYSGGWQAETFMGDDISAENSYFLSAKPEAQNAFKWADDIFPSGNNSSDVGVSLGNLYMANKVINEVAQSTNGSEQQKKAIQAEAQATRAWLYFQWVNIYGKPYQAASASQDPAFPIIKTADVTQSSYVRNSVQENYDLIISDLSAAIVNLPIENIVGPTRFSKPAAEGLLGKVYLFMGKNTEALAMFNAAFTDIAAQNAPARLYDYNKEFAAGGKFLPISSTGPANSPGNNPNDFTESVLAKTFYNGKFNGNGFGNDFFVLSPQASSLFGASDLRLKFYAAKFPNNVTNPSGRLSKYSESYARYGLQLSELYLLRAEVKARLNDLSGATKDVETLRKMRIPTKDALGHDIPDALVPPVIAADQNALIKFILDERVREFATEGYRWFDMRRLSVDPLFSGQTYTHILYKDASTANPEIFTLNPVRFTLRLPAGIMTSNPQFTNNP